MTTEKLVITVFAKDRPGIIRSISSTVLNNEGNWLESSLSRLCGQFTGIVHIQVNAQDKEQLLTALSSLANEGISVTVQNSDGVEPDEGLVDSIQILVEANDRPGIVKEISDALADADVNVDNIDTECESASMAGYPLFRAHMFLALPEGFTEQQLEEILEDVSDDLMVSILDE
ncbi:glycine cleavage system protein R [Arenicella xantha]|uniref:Glycine cleavage system transcriptional repressor n=1 Tax=Arenicella xantha TaxID=644221 RepID=A0A395JHH8_9GAMM|nr:ACT domain-containing protein [Arenicella xantha]RBP47089.1 glycine cleavage system regulatory protein [Arenicella xantha]